MVAPGSATLASIPENPLEMHTEPRNTPRTDVRPANHDASFGVTELGWGRLQGSLDTVMHIEP